MDYIRTQLHLWDDRASNISVGIMMSPKASTSASAARLKSGTVWRSVPRPTAAESAAGPSADARSIEPLAAVEQTVERAQAALLGRQRPNGSWSGQVRGAAALEGEYILLKCFLGQERDRELIRVANALRGLQEADGGWGQFPGGAADLSATVQAYFALKLLGDGQNAEHMRRARLVCLNLGGVGMCDTLTKYYLAALGQIGYDQCPAIPAELMLLPRWLYFNVYAACAPTRSMMIPLAIISAMRPVRPVAPENGIAELFHGAAENRGGPVVLPAGWHECFALADAWVQQNEKLPVSALRRKGLRVAEEWVLEHVENQQGLGVVFSPMCYALMALRALGYRDVDAKVAAGSAHLRDLLVEDEEEIRVQPCRMPVWDTGLALHALAEAGLHHSAPAAQAAGEWLIARECSRAADWVEVCPAAEPSGWFFEFANPYYPDVDATAIAAMALRRYGGANGQAAAGRGVDWMLAMQGEDGGWAAFHRTQAGAVLSHTPFVEAAALCDPSRPDITGRVLECLGHFGIGLDHPAVARAVAFLRGQQDDEGCWHGRSGVNYLYGTFQVLSGVRSAGASMDEDWVRQSAAWLRRRQHGDGSWGETCQSYDDPTLKGQGAPTASQTAWGVMGLLAASGPGDRAVRRGVRWLLNHQEADGCWRDDAHTATGFPGLSYLKCELYPLYFPLMALGRFRRLSSAGG